MQKLILTAVLICLAGCGSSIVILDEPPDCDYQKLGIVSGSDLLKDYEDIMREVKSQAFRLGADAVIVDKKYFDSQSMDFSERPGTINGTAIKYGSDCQ